MHTCDIHVHDCRSNWRIAKQLSCIFVSQSCQHGSIENGSLTSKIHNFPKLLWYQPNEDYFCHQIRSNNLIRRTIKSQGSSRVFFCNTFLFNTNAKKIGFSSDHSPNFQVYNRRTMDKFVYIGNSVYYMYNLRKLYSCLLRLQAIANRIECHQPSQFLVREAYCYKTPQQSRPAKTALTWSSSL